VSFEIFINEIEVGGVAGEFVSPNRFYCLYEGMVQLYIVFIEQIVCLGADVKKVLPPILFKFTEFGHFSHALIKQMLNFAVDIDI